MKSILLQKIKHKIRSLLSKQINLPTIEEKRKVLEYYRMLFQPEIFVETGTFFGDTVEYFKSKFKKIYSIELSEELAAKAKKRFVNDIHVNIIQGSSHLVLEHIVEKADVTALFWLDGHYSSEFWVDNEFIRTAKGEKNTPIIEELNILLNASIKHIILVDDARLFNGKEDYPTIKYIENKVKKCPHNYSFFVKKDIIHIIPQ